MASNVQSQELLLPEIFCKAGWLLPQQASLQLVSLTSLALGMQTYMSWLQPAIWAVIGETKLPSSIAWWGRVAWFRSQATLVCVSPCLSLLLRGSMFWPWAATHGHAVPW